MTERPSPGISGRGDDRRLVGIRRFTLFRAATPVRLLAVVLLCIVVLVAGLSRRGGHTTKLLLAGIAEDPHVPLTVIGVPATSSARYLDGTSVVDSSAGSPAAVAAKRWLAVGLVPGQDGTTRAIATRALLDLRLLIRPNGATAAGWYPPWEYVWPRDTSFVVAALAATGHRDDAVRALRFLQRVQRPDGTFAARTRLDGSGAVPDDRPPQLDAVGWVPWAAWTWFAAADPADPAARRELEGLWPMVAAAADAAAGSLDARGLPAASPDYWEAAAGQTVETAAALRTGLRAAADLAARTGRGADHDRWAGAAQRLDAGLGTAFAPSGFQRTPGQGGADSAVALLGPPFSPSDPAVAAAIATAERQLTLANGGILPGAAWRGDRRTAWTPETAFFALSGSAGGNPTRADRWLGWIAAHRTALGAVPEKIDAAGRPVSVAPLAWSDALVLLALTAQQHPLPIPPP